MSQSAKIFKLPDIVFLDVVARSLGATHGYAVLGVLLSFVGKLLGLGGEPF